MDRHDPTRHQSLDMQWPAADALVYDAGVKARTDHLYEKVKDVVTPMEWPLHAPLIDAINRLKVERGAVILAHNYMVVDSVPFYARLFNPAATPEQAAASGAMFAGQMRSLPNEQFLAMMEQGLPVQSLDTDFHPVLMEWFAASDQETVANAFAEISGSDFSPVLDGIDAPVLVLAPWADGAPVDAETLQSMYAAQYAPLASADVEIIEGARHFLMHDQAEAFNARLARFLAEQR